MSSAKADDRELPSLRRMQRRLHNIDRADRIISKGITWIMILAMILVGSSYFDMFRTTRQGFGTVEYHDFATLLRDNPDTVAWLALDNTHIDHPVVQGKDNFEYLDKDFYGKDYAGGTLFLDADCARDFSGEYQIIHGHHMAGGAMFGDLGRYLDAAFFEENETGQLLTPNGEYDLTVIGAGRVDAYDAAVYHRGGDAAGAMAAARKCPKYREVEWADSDKLLCLSTCSGEMNDNRTVVFCRMRKRKSKQEVL